MTSFAFILGVLPLCIASGAGAEMRRSLGVAVFSGMVGVTAFGINAIVLPPGYATGVHFHDEQEETYFVHDGEVEFRARAGIAGPLVDLRIVDADMNSVPHDGKSAGEIVLRERQGTL